MTTYTVKVENLDGVLARIREIQARGENLQPLHERIGAGLLSSVQLGFKSGTSPYGQAWAPIKFRSRRAIGDSGRLTAAQRKQFMANASGAPGQPLRDTGRLRSSITASPDAQGVTVGTNVIYAAVHQFGARIRPKNGKYLRFMGPQGFPIFAKSVTIPARPFLPLNSSGAADLPPSYQRTVITRIRAHFLEA